MSNFIDLKQFMDDGYLHEANRLFFHPLGLALTVHVTDKGDMRLEGIQDARHDPQGFIFGDLIDKNKIGNIDRIAYERRDARVAIVGSFIEGDPVI